MQERARDLAVRAMVPQPVLVAQGARKSMGMVGRMARVLVERSGLKPVAARRVAQLDMARE